MSITTVLARPRRVVPLRHRRRFARSVRPDVAGNRREKHLISNETEVHLVDQWCYLGTYKTEDDLSDAQAGSFAPNFNLDNYRIISSCLKGFTSRKQTHKQWEIEILLFPEKHPDKNERRALVMAEL